MQEFLATRKRRLPFFPSSRCRRCTSRLCTYSTHVCSVEEDPCLLGSPEQFCEAFYHVFRCPEFDVPRHGCLALNTSNCRLQSVALIVHMLDRFGQTRGIFRYTNCRKQHAEEFFVHDIHMQQLLSFISNGGKMRIFLKFQPCHHCSGNGTLYSNYLWNGKCDSKSCSELLLDFYKMVLHPLHITLEILISSIYKANWKFAKREDDILTVQNALDGIHLLLFEEGISMKALSIPDWHFLSSLTSGITRTHLLSSLRMQTDNGINHFLQGEQKSQAIRTKNTLQKLPSRNVSELAKSARKENQVKGHGKKFNRNDDNIQNNLQYDHDHNHHHTHHHTHHHNNHDNISCNPE